MLKIDLVLGSSALFISVFLATAASAQDVLLEGAAENGQLDLITVTAQRRSESVQEVPIAGTAVTGGRLATIGIQNLEEIRVATPGVNVRNGGGTVRAYIRGVGSAVLGRLQEASTTTYVDGAYVAAATSIRVFNPVSSVQILKRQQGTLFGRNASDSLIQVTTREPGFMPEASAYEGYGAKLLFEPEDSTPFLLVGDTCRRGNMAPRSAPNADANDF